MNQRLLFFVILSLLELAGEYLRIRPVIYVTKPLAIGLLLQWALAEWKSARDQQRVDRGMRGLYALAVVFCMAGDALLMVPERLFVPGLVAFLVGHLFYIAAMRSHPHTAVPGTAQVQPGQRRIVAVIAASYIVAAAVYLYPHLGAMRVPVVAYIVVIGSMLITAALTHPDTSRQYIVGMTGALIFALSDTAIAVNRFVEPFAGARVFIMATYLAGQWMIAMRFGLMRPKPAT